MYYRKRKCSKQKSQEIIQRLYKQVNVIYNTLNRLQRVLPGYLGLSYKGWQCLRMYVSELKDLEGYLADFPDDPQP